MHTVNIGGKERVVKFDLNAIIELEELTGVDITNKETHKDFTKVKTLRALAFVGLKWGAKSEKQEVDFTIEDVGGWLTVGDEKSLKFFEIFNRQGDSGEPKAEGEAGEAKK
jgi:hypothetical protein